MTIGIFFTKRGYTTLHDWTHHYAKQFTVRWGESDEEVLTFELESWDEEYTLDESPVEYFIRAYDAYTEAHFFSRLKSKYTEFSTWLQSGDAYVDGKYIPPNLELLEHEFYKKELPRISRRISAEAELLRKARSYFVNTLDYSEFDEKV